jgi:hypothetical protein
VTVAAVLMAALAGRVLAADGAGICTRCHGDESALGAAYGGHAPGLDCTSCHADRRPGVFGLSHRSVPRCSDCHEETRHPPRANGRRAPNRNCLRCHGPHGSPNLALVKSAIRTPAGRLAPIRFDSEAGAAPGGFTDPTDPGKGLCEVCHRKTDVYRANGRGEPHFTEQCTLCHYHPAGFAPVASDQNCTICHATEGEAFAKPSKHSTLFACSGCHAEVTPTPGPGHRALEQCSACHADVRTHAPPGYDFPCTQCHDPHGTDNIDLVLDAITTPLGTTPRIVFDNLLGRADGSFASASAPGSGVCEICHTTTLFYRAHGDGLPHFTFSCLPCHWHSRGFNPQ